MTRGTTLITARALSMFLTTKTVAQFAVTGDPALLTHLGLASECCLGTPHSQGRLL
ncbi:hypothetical protein LLE49_00865 [Alicyclobacillus tolerans]|uniref:hypothetical protein n=1 Tax=Alicyclobacillus tolerans TaxID=90970 RepID=UPI001F43E44E|nr:hypothetical protein [Alicyclobacillus tolerans]MCF8563295.1 hypothetical protein [Alicyclobacillus tolerans]